MKNIMLSKKNLLAAVIFLALFFLGLSFIVLRKEKIETEINGQKFQLEIAKTEGEREKGLSGRDSLCRNCGMFFIFPEKGSHGFWMKGMRFNLDIVWISDNRVAYVAKNVSYDSKETVKPEIPADKVLELNSGKADELGINVGDGMEFK